MRSKRSETASRSFHVSFRGIASLRFLLIALGMILMATVTIAFSGKISQAAVQKQQDQLKDALWQDVAESTIPPGERQIVPNAYRTLRLDINAMKQLLAAAPMEFTDRAKRSPLVMALPMPDGTMARFKVVESPIMPSDALAKHPELKTYSGQGIDDPTAITRFDITIRGFHAIILSTRDTVYIDPYAKQDIEHCISYYKRDYRGQNEAFRCFTEDLLATSTRPIAPQALSYWGTMHVYRLAVAATGEYTDYFRFPGDTDSQAIDRALAAITTTINRVNGIYGRDLAIRLELLNPENERLIIFADRDTDPYTTAPGVQATNDKNQETLDAVIGDGNYDIGHVVGKGGSGLAAIRSVCNAGEKAKGSTGTANPAGDAFDVDYVAHEMGHQFGANHTFNDGTNGSCAGGNRTGVAAYEPGSGSTIMAYASICGAANLQLNSDDYFHAKSVLQVREYITEAEGNDCDVEIQTGNNFIPLFLNLIYTVPKQTPFRLYGADINDPDPGDAITYTWEEYDLGNASPPEGDDGSRPIFRSYKPSRNSDRLLPSLQYILNNSNVPPPTYNCGTVANPVNCLTGESMPTTTRAMSFALTVRDNRDGVGVDFMTVNIDSNSGPVVVQQPAIGVLWPQGTSRNVTWSVANTNNPPVNCANVKIRLSTDGGNTFPIVLAESTPNDGSEAITVPEVITNQARIKVEAAGETLGVPDNIFFDITDGNFTIQPPVVTTADDGSGDNLNPVAGSLREVLLATATLSPPEGIYHVVFNIPGGPGLKTINLAKELPAIVKPVFIDGWSQGAPGYSGSPLIELNGAGAVPNPDGSKASGLIINAGGSGSYIKGLTINRFGGTGIALSGNNNTIDQCYIGTDAAGSGAAGNGFNGVYINFSSNNRLFSNVISGNDVGVHIAGSGASGNLLQKNFIGTNATGTARIPNASDGIRISNSPGNSIGGIDAGGLNAGNVISGNGKTFSPTGVQTFADGIEINGSDATGNIIEGNRIGLNQAGTAGLDNTASGIHIIGAPNTLIGGTDAVAANLIGDSGVLSAFGANGIEISGSTAAATLIQGNYIGTDVSGTLNLGVRGSGIYIDSAPNTMIGGTAAGAKNVISGSKNAGGIRIGGLAATGTFVQGNFIGTNAAGTAAIGNNAAGILIESANNQIGGTAPGARNIISGNFNGGGGIWLSESGASGNIIQGNYIGTDVSGTVDLGNANAGILLTRAVNNTIGGTSPSARNIISGNNNFGIQIFGVSGVAGNNTIQGNYIGTDVSGNNALGNGIGVRMDDAANNTLGGTAAGAGNVISASTGLGAGGSFGVLIFSNVAVTGIKVEGNLIGTNAAGTAALGNLSDGIRIGLNGNSSVTIGGTMAGARNVISANGLDGINMNGTTITVKGNYIGTDITGTANLGNARSGIEIGGGNNNLIGGTGAGEGNLIAFNGAPGSGFFYAGVQVFSTANAIRGNSIFSNTGLGIDLVQGGGGITTNDACDGDAGANNLQNFPVLTSAGSSAGTTTLSGTLNSAASTTFNLDFYASPTCNGSGNGEGQTYLGSLPVTTDGGCNASFALSLPVAVAAGQTITATATDATGNTSEFSACAQVTASTTIPAGNYANLVINSGTTMMLSGDVTVTGNLTLNGDLNTGGFTLTMPATATTTGNGDVIGNVKRTGFVIGTPLSFGNPFNTLRFDSGTPPTEVTFNLVKSPPAVFPNAVARTYTITPVGSSNYSATLQLHYQDAELNGNDEATLQLWRNDGSAWVGQGATTREPINNWVQLTGVTQFSPWTIAGPGGPTAIELVSFQATGYDNGTLLEWQTGFEADNLGFNLYREEAGKRVLINNQIVAGSALRAGSVLSAGDKYGWWDASTNKYTAYWLEDLDLKGRSTWHGPFFANFVGGNPSAHSNAALLSKLGTPQNDASATHVVEAIAKPLHALSNNANLSLNVLAAESAVKIAVKGEGFYRLSQAELLAAGLEPSVDPRRLQLFVDGAEIPISVSTDKDGLLESVEFYGLGLDTPSTDARAYWLVAGKQTGKRIRTVEAEGVSSSLSNFTATVERRNRSIYFAALRNGERENFFGAVITSQTAHQTLSLQNLAQQAESSTLEIALQGVTQTAHRVAVQLNDVIAGFIDFNGQQPGAATFTLPHSLLREGLNTVRLTSQNGAGDVSLVDQIRLAYQHTYTADNNTLKFSAAGPQHFRIDGFTSKQVRVFDVTDPANPTQLMGKVSESKSGYDITCASPDVGERKLFALADDQLQQPAVIKANSPSNWRNAANAADFIIITAKNFFASQEPLKQKRESQGYKVALVDVEDLYDEFNFGHKSPLSVRDFLGFAKSNWKLAPRFVLLVGDASYDPKNYLGLGDWDLVPTKLVDTTYLETACDDWFADLNNRDQAELAIGRLPVRSSEEATTVISKILRFEETQAVESALLVSDANEGFNFEQASAQLKSWLPPTWRVEELRRGGLDAELAKARLVEALGRGQRLVNYVGHGSVNAWRGNLLTAEEAQKLHNRQLPVFVLMNCLNGYFHDAQNEALAESLMKAESGGAVAVWASSGMSLPNDQTVINQALYRVWFASGSKGLTLGDAVGKAKAAVTNPDLRRTWVLLGDPTMAVR